MARLLAVFCSLAFVVAASGRTSAQPAPTVNCEFRVFDGTTEISRETRIRVYQSGHHEDGIGADSAGRAALVPGLYDVQAIREREGQVTGIVWLRGLLVQRYPDEGGRHVEILNAKPNYGALELRSTGQADADVTAFAAGDRTKPVTSALPGNGYRLLVLAAGRYDIRLKGTGADAAETWLTDIEIPAGRTLMRVR